jgi:hypothetical protein
LVVADCSKVAGIVAFLALFDFTAGTSKNFSGLFPGLFGDSFLFLGLHDGLPLPDAEVTTAAARAIAVFMGTDPDFDESRGGVVGLIGLYRGG